VSVNSIQHMLAVASPLTSAAFAKHFGKTEEKAKERVKEFLIDSNEEAIHDIRVSIRRLDSCIRLFPNNLRSMQKISNYRSQYKVLFKINSEIRDIDIISSKLKKHSTKEGLDQIKSFEQELHDKKSEKLKEAREKALLTYNIKPLRVNDGDISERKLQQRFQKIVTRFAGRIDQLFPIVASDVGKTKELHQLRKDCKKLRYTLEVLDDDTRQNEVVLSLIGYLEDLQDVLGTIHDCDIVIEHLKASYSNYLVSGGDIGIYHELLQIEQDERQALYHAFVDLYGDNSEDEEGNGDLPVRRNTSGRRIIKVAATQQTVT
jgi:CHAD domain-containing protein